MKHFILFMIELAVKSGIESSLLTNREWYSLLMHMLKKVTNFIPLYIVNDTAILIFNECYSEITYSNYKKNARLSTFRQT